MVLWFVFAVMTALATLAVLAPLARARRRADAAGAPEAHDVAVYTDQLEELERDRERGLIAPGEAEAARTEIARRALRAGEAAAAAAPPARSLARPAALVAAIAVPALAVSIYLLVGSPDLPAQPLAARLEAVGDNDLGAMIARVERHLAENPADAEGWRVLAPVYARTGRFDAAANAWRHVIRINGPSPQASEELGEMLVAANDGLMSTEAEAAFASALQADPSRVKARFYRALGHLQAGRTDAAVADYDEILRSSPPDAPWLEAVRRDRAAALVAGGAAQQESAGGAAQGESAGGAAQDGIAGGTAADAAPGPDAAAIAAAAQMSADEQSAMIASMVDGLAERLRDEPGDAEGWQRLIRAYGVLGRTDEAREAFETASATFAAAPDTLARIRQVAADAGVAVE